MNWYLNGRLVHPDEFHKMIVSEKGFHSFIFEVIRASDTGTYECVATNRAGEAAFTVKLDVIGKTYGLGDTLEGKETFQLYIPGRPVPSACTKSIRLRKADAFSACRAFLPAS